MGSNPAPVDDPVTAIPLARAGSPGPHRYGARRGPATPRGTLLIQVARTAGP